LGQLRPANTTAAALYTPRTGIIGVVTSIIVCNTSGASAAYRLFHDFDGTTYDQTTALVYDDVIDPAFAGVLALTRHILTFDGGITISPGGNLACRTSVNSAFTFTAYGYELSKL
jgi:hypothetical protein